MLGNLVQGGFAFWGSMVPLVFCSALSLAVICERLLTLNRAARAQGQALSMMPSPGESNAGAALERMTATGAPIAAVVRAGMQQNGRGRDQAKDAMDRASALQTERLQRNLGILATVGSTAPFIGLFGTVVGIIHAFQAIASKGFGGPSVVAAGIAEALVATALGLFVAIPAVIAYNYFVGRVNRFTIDLDYHSTEALALVSEAK
jgi:biopolymer transport protein ExbB/TolQ